MEVKRNSRANSISAQEFQMLLLNHILSYKKIGLPMTLERGLFETGQKLINTHNYNVSQSI